MTDEPHIYVGNCPECGEFDCELDHAEGDYQEDDWMFDASGMVGDD